MMALICFDQIQLCNYFYNIISMFAIKYSERHVQEGNYSFYQDIQQIDYRYSENSDERQSHYQGFVEITKENKRNTLEAFKNYEPVTNPFQNSVVSSCKELQIEGDFSEFKSKAQCDTQLLSEQLKSDSRIEEINLKNLSKIEIDSIDAQNSADLQNKNSYAQTEEFLKQLISLKWSHPILEKLNKIVSRPNKVFKFNKDNKKSLIQFLKICMDSNKIDQVTCIVNFMEQINSLGKPFNGVLNMFSSKKKVFDFAKKVKDQEYCRLYYKLVSKKLMSFYTKFSNKAIPEIRTMQLIQRTEDLGHSFQFLFQGVGKYSIQMLQKLILLKEKMDTDQFKMLYFRLKSEKQTIKKSSNMAKAKEDFIQGFLHTQLSTKQKTQEYEYNTDKSIFESLMEFERPSFQF